MVLKMMMFGAPGHAGHQMLHHVTSFYGAMQSMLQYRLVQSGKTASGGCSGVQGSSEL
jgi:hypothetical protein